MCKNQVEGLGPYLKVAEMVFATAPTVKSNFLRLLGLARLARAFSAQQQKWQDTANLQRLLQADHEKPPASFFFRRASRDHAF